MKETERDVVWGAAGLAGALNPPLHVWIDDWSLGTIDPEQLRALTRAAPQALKATAEQPEPPGLWKLLSEFLWNHDIGRGLSAFKMLLENFGSNLATPKRDK